ncbi:MAG: hypothetical protein AAF548_05110 [Actinomycetota bacterium]
MPDHSRPGSSDPNFAARIQAEIAAAADERRREDPVLARTEREIERAWAEVAPPGAVGPSEELLLDRVDRLAMVDVDAPVGEKPGVRHVKGAIRKGTYWYLRYMSDQLNAFHNVQARLLRRFDDRLGRLEAAAGLGRTVDGLVERAPVAGTHAGRLVADAANGRVLVLAAGTGDAVAELGPEGYGVEVDAHLALVGIDAGLDVRVGPPIEHLVSLEASTLGGVMIAGEAQRITPSEAVDLVAAAGAACGPGGVVAVAVEDRSARSVADAELLAGRGLAPETWAALLGPLAATIERNDGGDPGIETVLIARLP